MSYIMTPKRTIEAYIGNGKRISITEDVPTRMWYVQILVEQNWNGSVFRQSLQSWCVEGSAIDSGELAIARTIKEAFGVLVDTSDIEQMWDHEGDITWVKGDITLFFRASPQSSFVVTTHDYDRMLSIANAIAEQE